MTSRPATTAGEGKEGGQNNRHSFWFVLRFLSTVLVSTNRKMASQEEKEEKSLCTHAVVLMDFPL